jgi:hypothetical protein
MFPILFIFFKDFWSGKAGIYRISAKGKGETDMKTC